MHTYHDGKIQQCLSVQYKIKQWKLVRCLHEDDTGGTMHCMLQVSCIIWHCWEACNVIYWLTQFNEKMYDTKRNCYIFFLLTSVWWDLLDITSDNRLRITVLEQHKVWFNSVGTLCQSTTRLCSFPRVYGFWVHLFFGSSKSVCIAYIIWQQDN